MSVGSKHCYTGYNVNDIIMALPSSDPVALHSVFINHSAVDMYYVSLTDTRQVGGNVLFPFLLKRTVGLQL